MEIIDEIENEIAEVLSPLIHRKDKYLLSDPENKICKALKKIAEEVVPALIKKIEKERIYLAEARKENDTIKTLEITRSTPLERIRIIPVLKKIYIGCNPLMAVKNEKEFLVVNYYYPSEILSFFRKNKLVRSFIFLEFYSIISITYLKGKYWIITNHNDGEGQELNGVVFKFSPAAFELDLFYEAKPGELFYHCSLNAPNSILDERCLLVTGIQNIFILEIKSEDNYSLGRVGRMKIDGFYFHFTPKIAAYYDNDALIFYSSISFFIVKIILETNSIRTAELAEIFIETEKDDYKINGVIVDSINRVLIVLVETSNINEGNRDFYRSYRVGWFTELFFYRIYKNDYDQPKYIGNRK